MYNILDLISIFIENSNPFYPGVQKLSFCKLYKRIKLTTADQESKVKLKNKSIMNRSLAYTHSP